MKLFKTWFVPILVVLLAFIVRFVQLDKVPASLYYDEIDLGYQVRSLLTTGKDYRNTISPFFFKAFNTDKTPLPIYFSSLTSLFFSSPEYQVRAGAAVAGVICVILAMVLAYQVTGKKQAVIITGLVFGFSPWLIQFSRIAFEAIFMLMIFMMSISVFLKWIEKRDDRWFFFSALLFGLNIYTYRTMSLFAPLAVILLGIIYFKEIWKMGLVKVGIWIAIFAGITLPFLYATTIGSADQTRIGQISIFSDPMIPIQVMRNREVDSGDFANPEIGKQPVWWSKVFHNKGVSYITFLAHNYYKNFSTEFLFLTGDPNGRHNPKDTGQLIYLDAIALIFGLSVVFKNLKDKKYRLLLGLLLLSPLPADITMDGARHASRLMLMAAPLLLTISIGYLSIVEWLNKNFRIGIVVLAVLWSIGVVFYLQKYFVHYPIESARDFSYGYKQAIEKIAGLKDQYKNVRLTTANDPPMLYYFYFANVPPSQVQEYGTEFGDEITKNLPLDHVKPGGWKSKLCTFEEISRMNPETIYMAGFNDLPMDFRSPDRDMVPKGIKLIAVIKYPDNEIAYYLVTRDTKDGKPVLSDKKQNCK